MPEKSSNLKPSVSTLTNSNPRHPPRQMPAKTPSPRLKLVIRHLPPNLTQAEFETTLGGEWKIGAGKTVWSEFRPGKIYTEQVIIAKPPRPSRAYLQLVDSSQVDALADKIQNIEFPDAQYDQSPCLEFATFQRTLVARKRADPREGSIHMDPEFIAFLETLTSPTPKPLTVDAAIRDEKIEEVKSTPLIQHLREKKAAKEKAKSERVARVTRAEATESKAEVKVKESEKGDSKPSRRHKADAKETVTRARSPARANGEGKKKEKSAGSGATATAAAMIQRDLGMKGSKGDATRRSGAGAQAKQRSTSQDAISADAAHVGKPAPKTVVKAPSILKRQPNEPNASKPAASAPKTAVPPAKAVDTTKTSSSNSAATKAFLKHVNLSQGMTEARVAEALTVFGQVSKVEIDKRKCFAYVDFADSKGLRAAVTAGSAQIGQGTVQIAERRDRPKSTTTNSPSIAATNASTPSTTGAATGGGTKPNFPKGGRANRGKGTNSKAPQASSTTGPRTSKSTEPA